jgi:predicted transcriptional regulator
MRTTLDIDDEVLAAVKEVAKRERLTAGQVVSRYMRQVFTGTLVEVDRVSNNVTDVTGFRPFTARGKLVTNDEIDRLRDKKGI